MQFEHSRHPKKNSLGAGVNTANEELNRRPNFGVILKGHRMIRWNRSSNRLILNDKLKIGCHLLPAPPHTGPTVTNEVQETRIA